MQEENKNDKEKRVQGENADGSFIEENDKI